MTATLACGHAVGTYWLAPGGVDLTKRCIVCGDVQPFGPANDELLAAGVAELAEELELAAGAAAAWDRAAGAVGAFWRAHENDVALDPVAREYGISRADELAMAEVDLADLREWRRALRASR